VVCYPSQRDLTRVVALGAVGHGLLAGSPPSALRRFNGEGLVRPEGWPVVDGRLTCLTCHQVRLACDSATRRSVLNPAFLRGTHYGDLGAFCRECHRSRRYQKFNPHIMLAPDGAIREEVCALCHKKKMDPAQTRRTGQPQLRGNELIQCKSCHPSHVTYYEGGHLGAKVGAEMLAYLAAREISGPSSRPSRRLVQRFQRSGARPTKVVLDAENRITCTSCHNPHQKGVFAGNCVLADNAMRLIGTDKVISDVRHQRFCLRCHDK